MSVLVETTLGEVVIDLYTERCPLASKNFLKLCKLKFYNNVLVYNVQQNFMIQTGDPTGTGKGGISVYGMLYGEQARYFDTEAHQDVKHNRAGLVCMASSGENHNSSQFYITMRGEDLEFLDGKHTIFGEVAEGLTSTLQQINELYCDTEGRPYRDVRILHTYVLEDPFDDPAHLAELLPDASPARDRPPEETIKPRLVDLEGEEGGLTPEELEEKIRETEAKKRAVVLEMIGDLPDAEIKPPENVLFVCKLNPITTDEDLDIIFSRFGDAKTEIIRDAISGDSLNYAFVEFNDVEPCEEAYKKMNNALIDDRRIKVDFSQSVAKIWNKYTMRSRGTKIKSRGVAAPVNDPQKFSATAAASSKGAGDGGVPRAKDGDLRKLESRGEDAGRHSRRPRSRSQSSRERWREREERSGGHQRNRRSSKERGQERRRRRIPSRSRERARGRSRSRNGRRRGH